MVSGESLCLLIRGKLASDAFSGHDCTKVFGGVSGRDRTLARAPSLYGRDRCGRLTQGNRRLPWLVSDLATSRIAVPPRAWPPRSRPLDQPPEPHRPESQAALGTPRRFGPTSASRVTRASSLSSHSPDGHPIAGRRLERSSEARPSETATRNIDDGAGPLWGILDGVPRATVRLNGRVLCRIILLQSRHSSTPPTPLAASHVMARAPTRWPVALVGECSIPVVLEGPSRITQCVGSRGRPLRTRPLR
jgi:hypothetical protein